MNSMVNALGVRRDSRGYPYPPLEMWVLVRQLSSWQKHHLELRMSDILLVVCGL